MMKLELKVWLNRKCYEVSIDIGWFSGSDFSLLGLDICEATEGFFTIVQLQVAKFVFGLYLSEVK